MGRPRLQALVVIAFAATTLAACSPGATPDTGLCLGTWQLESLDAGDASMTAEEVAEYASQGIDFVLTVNDDGTVDLAGFGNEDTGTWQPSPTGCVLEFEGVDNTATVEGDRMELGMSTSDAVFKKVS